MAQHSESSCEWPVRFTSVLNDQVPGQRGKTYNTAVTIRVVSDKKLFKVGPEETLPKTHNQKTVPLGATKFAKENDQQ